MKVHNMNKKLKVSDSGVTCNFFFCTLSILEVYLKKTTFQNLVILLSSGDRTKAKSVGLSELSVKNTVAFV